MNVSHQNTDNLNAVISIEISKADYQEKVDKSLRAYGQKANIPGFRKGKVPFSMLVWFPSLCTIIFVIISSISWASR